MRKDQFNFKGIPRGEKKYYYRYSDIGRITDLSIGTLRNYVSQGIFDIKSVESVAKFISERNKVLERKK